MDALPTRLCAEAGTAHRARHAGHVVDHILPALGSKPVAEIIFADVEQLHRSIAAPYRANRTYESLRRVLNLCVQWQWLDRNPAKGLETNRETPRTSYLTLEQVRAVLAALPTTRPAMQ